MAVSREDVLKLVKPHRGQGDGLCDGQGGKPRKYYNKYNKKNKNNKNKHLVSSVGSLVAKDQKTDHKPSEEIIKNQKPLEKDNNNLAEKKKEKDDLSQDWITNEEIIKASVQLYKNPRTRTSGERKILKLQFETKDEGYIDYIATLSTSDSSLRRFSNTISKENQQLVIEVAQRMKKLIKEKSPKHKAYIGKFRETSGDLFVEGSRGNMPIEEATIGIVWYDPIEHNWQFYIFFQNWDHGGRFETEGITQKQKDTNMTGMYIYYPEMKIKKLSRTERRRQARLIRENKNET